MRDLSCHLTRSETILSYPTPTGSDLPTPVQIRRVFEVTSLVVEKSNRHSKFDYLPAKHTAPYLWEPGPPRVFSCVVRSSVCFLCVSAGPSFAPVDLMILSHTRHSVVGVRGSGAAAGGGAGTGGGVPLWLCKTPPSLLPGSTSTRTHYEGACNHGSCTVYMITVGEQ